MPYLTTFLLIPHALGERIAVRGFQRTDRRATVRQFTALDVMPTYLLLQAEAHGNGLPSRNWHGQHQLTDYQSYPTEHQDANKESYSMMYSDT